VPGNRATITEDEADFLQRVTRETVNEYSTDQES
jgi:hypothetical protein